MNRKIRKILAATVSGAMLLSFAGCSSVADMFELDHSTSRRDRHRDRDDDDDADETESEEENAGERASASRGAIPTPGGGGGSSDTGSGNGTGTGTVTVDPDLLSDDLVYLDHIPTEEEIHPGHAPGTLSGAAAEQELDDIEIEVISHYVTSYIDAVILFEHPENFGIEIDEVSWGTGYSNDPEDEEEEDTFVEDILERLYAIDYETLSPDDRVFYDKIVYDMEDTQFASEYTALGYYESTFNALVGPQCDVMFLLDVLKFDDVQDAEDYITLIRDIDRYYDELCLFEEDRAAYGFASSDSIYSDVADSFDALVEQEDDCFLYESFENRLDNINGLSAADRERLIADHEDAMRNVFFPEMQECSDRMRALIGSGGPEGGVLEYPYGAEYFAYAFRGQSNCSRDIESVTEDLEEYTYNMIDDYKATLSGNYLLYLSYLTHEYTQGDTADNLEWLREQVVGTDFPELCDHEYALIDVPEAMEDNFSPAAYLGYHLDTFDSNQIITNNANVDEDFGITCAHEGYPGHMFQSVYTRMATDHPYMYIFDSTAYAEGWATYVENYSFKYFEDDEDLITVLSSEDQLNILLMARWDIGINYDGWTIGDCIDYYEDLMDVEPGTITEEDLESTYNLLASDPCYAVKYGVGFLNTTEIMQTLHDRHPQATDLEIHTAYLDALTGTFEQIAARADEILTEQGR
ncbi:MAG: DUF885 family protein [Clostridiales bacterium]|nr:DUF885 family protein [Clostridiales bacterium]